MLPYSQTHLLSRIRNFRADDASEQNDKGETDGSGRAAASLSAIDRK